MKVAYLINQYPHLSCTFIRREICGLEQAGVAVDRYAIRPSPLQLVDEVDQLESAKTRYILTGGIDALMIGLFYTLLRRPLVFARTLALSLKLGQQSERGILIHLVYLLEACVLKRWLDKSPVDCLHAHFATNGTTVAMLCHELGGPPFSFTVHGPHAFDNTTAIGLAEKIKRAAFVVAVSEFTRSQLLRYCSYQHWEKIRVVHCGVDEIFSAPEYVDLPLAPRMVAVGQLEARKGFHILLEAMGQLFLEGERFELIIAGDGLCRAELSTLIHKLGLTDYVSITGWLSNEKVKTQICRGSVLVHPAFAEGLPVVMMEALMLGRPVIGTNIAGVPELIQPGINGWLVPAGSTAALAQAMREALYTDPKILAEMGLNGRQQVIAHFTAYNEAVKLSGLFQDLVLNQTALSLAPLVAVKG